MNRPKEYNREEILSKATALFWEKGFEETSVGDIVASTNVNRFSIYNGFGDKEKLYLACMDHYISISRKYLEDILTKKPLGMTNIEAFLEERVCHTFSKNIKGCLIFNSVVKEKVLSKDINKKTDARVAKIKSLLLHCLHAAQERKEISTNKDCKRLANYLVCFTFGMINIGMKNTTKKELRKIANDALSTIKN